ncbi:MAG: hypothetical protein ACTSUE_02790 [Promethearchaeota archaeon]
MIEFFIAMGILAGILVLFGIIINKTRDNKKILTVVCLTILVAFLAMAVVAIPNVLSWEPLQNFIHLFTTITFFDAIYNAFIFIFYFVSGFSLGVGFLQILFRVKQDIRIKQIRMAQKSIEQNILHILELYLFVIVVAGSTRLLLDVFGISFAVPQLALVLDSIMIFPLAWEIAGLLIAGLKFSRTRTFTLNYSCQVDERFSNEEKIYLHKIITILVVGLGVWFFIVLEFTVPSIEPYPGVDIFYISLLGGFVDYLLNKKIQQYKNELLATFTE